MERIVYDRMAEHDQSHWWYCARREILADLIRRRARPPAGAHILEIGCGTGHNLGMLAEFGSVDGIEIDPAAAALARRRLGKPLIDTRLPALDGVKRGHYDLVGAFDVIEHIDEDQAALVSIAQILKPGGRLVLTVPAHQWMWSAHDDANHHKRRYSKPALASLVERSPLRLDSIGYFNSLLFPVAIAARFAGRLTGNSGSDDRPPPAPVNWLFEKIFAAERHLIGRAALPPGLSLFAVASAT